MTSSRIRFTVFSLILVAATSQIVDGQTQRPLPKADGFTSSQTSLGLIDDLAVWTINNISAKDGVASLPIQTAAVANTAAVPSLDLCGLDGDLCHKALQEADAVVASMTECKSCALNSNANLENSRFCQQMTTLLAITLNAPGVDAKTKNQAINAAMMMVADHSALAANARVDQLQLQHTQAMTAMHQRIARLPNPTPNPTPQTVFTPWVKRQNRQGINPIEILAAQAKAERKKAEDRKLAERHALRLREANRLRQEIKNLDQRIEELMRNPVRPVGLLKPVYSSDQPLKPLAFPLQQKSPSGN